MLGISPGRTTADERIMGSFVMNTESHWVIERFGPRGARLVLITSATIFIALICGWAGVEMTAAWQAHHELRSAIIGAVALLLIFLSLRIMAVNWRATRDADNQPMVLPDGNDQSGVWGVGGPSMREPGSTGAWPMRVVDRRYDNKND